MSGAESVYTPFEAPYRMAMGVKPLADGEWLELDADCADDLREKRRLLKERRDQVLRLLPGSEAAQAELLRILVDYLDRWHPRHCRLDGKTVHLPALGERYDLDDPAMAPLDLAGRLVQEDFCLLQRNDTGWCLTAASVCFPTRWDLVAKMGKPLADIHDPVPGFRDTLADPVSLFFDRMRVDKPVWRLNWSLLDDPALFQPAGHNRGERRADIDADNAGDKVILRVERQTLRRLPQSGAIVFTIRIHRWPLSVLKSQPEAAARLRAAMASMPDAMRGYKSLAVFEEAAAAWLLRHAGETDVASGPATAD